LGIPSLKLNNTEIALLLLVAIALYKSDFEIYKIENILIDFSKPVIFILTLASIRSSRSMNAFYDIKLKRIFSLYGLTTSIAVVIGLYYYEFIGVIYPAYSSIYSLLGYFYLMRSNRSLWTIYFLLLLFSGKRGVLIGGILAQISLNNIRNNLIFLILIFSLYIILIYNENILIFFSEKMMKLDISMITNSSDYLNIAKNISGGRLDEIIDGLSYELEPLNVLFGRSLGYTYDSLAFNEADHKNFHFTPASLFVNYGIIFTIIFIKYIIRILFNSTSKILADRYENAYIIRMYLIGSLFFFLTEYGVFGYVNFCIGLGILAGGRAHINAVIKES
jgi:hypothetical protein